MINDHTTCTELVRNYTRIIDKSNNWNIPLTTKRLHIKQRKPSINQALKAKELHLF